MFKEPLIPMRPSDFVSDLSQSEQSCLTWFVLSGCSKADAYLKFVRPDFVDSKAKPAVDSAVRQFYAAKPVKDYIEAYTATIKALLDPKPKVSASPKGTMEERKAKTKTKLVEFAMSLADRIEEAEDPEAVLKIADKIGLLEQDEQAEEVPRRYLPVTCSMCEYRKFVEENCEHVENGTDFDDKEK